MNAQLFYRTTDYGIEICGKQSFGDRQDGKKRFLKKDADKVLFDFNLYGVMIQIRFI